MMTFPYEDLALMTDLYQLTMAYGFWKTGIHQKEVVFQQFFRSNPFGGGYTVASGLEALVEFMHAFHFSQGDLDYLSSLEGDQGGPLFEEAFLKELGQTRFTCDVDAVPEGTVVFPQEPLVRVKGPLLQAQLLETPLLNLINFPTLIATKAARICSAAQGDPVLEFGLRRAQGVDGGLTASRAAYVGGCHATSNVLAGKCFGIPVKGTHAHSWVMVFDDELQSFQAYAEVMPDNCVFLVDTYDTITGVQNAIKVGRWLKERGKRMIGVRLDSGDLAYLSQQARKLLDESGFEDTAIVASNELDENIIHDLKRQDSKITIWGVGTHLATGGGQKALDGVYKLSAIRDDQGKWDYRLKLSERLTKVSNPGILQVRRYYRDGECYADVIHDTYTDISQGVSIVDPFDVTRSKSIPPHLEHEDLLVPIFRGGELCYSLPSLSKIRETTLANLGKFHPGVRRFVHPHQYVVGMERGLYNLKMELVNQIRSAYTVRKG